MSLTVTINNTPVKILNDNNCTVDRTIDMANTCQFTAVDITGLQHWQPGQPVSIVDSLLGLLFTGYIDNVDETNLYPQVAILSKVTCSGTRYLADKRYYNGQEFSNALAGDIVTAFLATMAQDGIKASYNRDHSASYADWSTGTLVGTAPSMDLDGCLELAPAGTQINQSYSPTGTGLANYGGSITGGAYTCSSFNALQYEADCVISGLANEHLYTKIWSGSHTIIPGDYLQYDIWINSNSPAQMAAVDFTCSDGTVFRSNTVTWDNERLTGAPTNDLTAFAKNKWYSRSIGLAVTGLNGKVITSIALAFGGSSTGHYTAYFRRISITGSSPVTVFSDTSTTIPTLPQIIGNSGYANMLCNVVTAYDSSGAFGSPAKLDMSPAAIYNSSLVSWAVDIPANCSVVVTMCIDSTSSGDASAVYLATLNNTPIPGLTVGQNLQNAQLDFFFYMTNTGPDPTVSPALHSFTIQINPSYAANKTDYRYKIKNDSDYTAGVMSANLVESSRVLKLNGFQAPLTNANLPALSLFGSAGPAYYPSNGFFTIQSDTNTDARVRMDFAGTWANGVMEVDLQLGANANSQVGMVYRCTNWGNGNNTFAYVVLITPVGIQLGRGVNSTSGTAQTYSNLITATLALNAGDWHRLKIVFNGSLHTVYLDDVQYINFTDSTYTAAGYVGLRFYNGSGINAQIGNFYNFGIASGFSGTWVSPSFNLSNVGTVAAAFTRTQGQGDASQSSLLTEISYDGGTTWQTCAAPPIATTNQGSWTYDSESIPGLSPGVNTASLTNCKLRLTLTVSSVAAHIETNGTILYVISSYSASGYRLSRPLSINNVSRIGSASLSWSGQAPTNTNIQVESSRDGINWVVEGTGASGSVTISGINTQPDPIIDTFDTKSNASYTNTAAPSTGSPATWYYDTANSRLQASGGVDALYINNVYSVNDGSVLCDLDYSEGGGLVLHYNVNNVTGQIRYYYAVINDSAATLNPNTLQLFKQDFNSGTPHVYALSALVPINFTHGSAHRFILEYLAGVVSVSIDGAQVTSFDDNSTGFPITSGNVGLYNSGGASEFYQLYIQGLGDPVLEGSKISTRVTLTSTDPTQTPKLQDLAVTVRDNSIHDGNVIPSTSYSVLSSSQNTIAQSMDDLAKQSNTVWYIDESLNLNFKHKLGQPAPWIADGSAMIASSITCSNIQPGYRNVKWMNNGKDQVTKQQTITGDGQTTSWDLGYPVQIINSMLLDGYAVSFAPKGQTGAMFYYEAGKTTITADPSTRILGGLDKLIISYVGLVSITVQMRHTKAKKKRATVESTAQNKSSGAVELIQDATGLNKAGALQLASGLLNEYTQTGHQLVFTTMNVGLAPGQLLTVFLPQFALFDDVLVITDVSITWQKTNQNGIQVLQPFFTITAVEGAIVGDWTRLFSRLGKS